MNKGKRVAGVIAVSHLRALHEALSTTSSQLLIALEGNATGTEKAPQLFASLVAYCCTNPELKYTKSVSLIYSNWHGLYDKLIRENHKVVKGSRAQTYFHGELQGSCSYRQHFLIIGLVVQASSAAMLLHMALAMLKPSLLGSVETGKLQFGQMAPSEGSSESEVGSDDWNFELFKRETDLRTSVSHFLTMALCDYQFATKGSTVHDHVYLLNNKSSGLLMGPAAGAAGQDLQPLIMSGYQV